MISLRWPSQESLTTRGCAQHCLTVHWAEVNRSRSSRRRTIGFSFKSDALKAIEQRIGSRDSRDLWGVPRAGLVEGGELVGRDDSRERRDSQ